MNTAAPASVADYLSQAFHPDREYLEGMLVERNLPDVVIMRGGMPSGRIIQTLPEVAVEVLSPDDRASAIESKIADYLQFGVACVWVIDPETRRAFMHWVNPSREAMDGFLRNPAGDLTVPLSAICS